MTDRAVRVQFDVTRPATVRLFAHAIEELARRGHETLVTARDAGGTTALLDDAGIEHQVVSSRRSSRLLAGPTKLLHEVRVVVAARSFVPDVVVSETNPAAGHAAHLFDAEAPVFPIDERRADRFAGLVQPFAEAVHTPAAFGVNFGASSTVTTGVTPSAGSTRTVFVRTPSACGRPASTPTSRSPSSGSEQTAAPEPLERGSRGRRSGSCVKPSARRGRCTPSAARTPRRCRCR